MSKCVSIAALVLIISMVAPAHGSDVLAILTVEPVTHTIQDAPVAAELAGIPGLERDFYLAELKGSARVPVPFQIEVGPTMKLWWVLSGETAGGQSRQYEIIRGKPVDISRINIIKTDKFLDIRRGTNPVLRYYHGVMPPPAGKSTSYSLSGFIHPLWTPHGEVLTQIHPPDHIHHMGLWAPWTRAKYQGRAIDFWNLRAASGTVRFVNFTGQVSGPVFGGFQALQDHVELKSPDGEKTVLNETLDVRVWNLPGAGKGYLVDYISAQKCAGPEALLLEKYRYGGFGYRSTDKFKGDNRNYLTSEGKTLVDADGSRARWCNIWGKMDKENAGILFMSHPANHEHPEPVRIWDKRFNDTFFNFCPIKQNPWTLEPGKNYVRKYRIYMYDVTITAQQAQQIWEGFAHRPQVKCDFQRGNLLP